VAIAFYRLLGMTWRYVEVGREAVDAARDEGQPLVGAFFHSRTFALLYYYSRDRLDKWLLMCSQSRDGDAMAAIEEGLGYRVVRGSTGAGGGKALVGMIRIVKKEGFSTCLAIDGSRGPRGIVQLGVLVLAQKTGGLLVPAAASARWSVVWRSSWDRTVLPLPFAKVHVVYGAPTRVPPGLDAEELERLRVDLEQRLLEVHERADELSGFQDTEPLQVPAP
jgi:hypothetical protein